MRDRVLVRLLVGILILSAIMRIGFLVSGQVLPVNWDARRYVCAGVALLSFVDDSGPEPSSDAQLDRKAFDHYYQKYIQGEKIDWQSYAPHSLTQARDDLFYGGPLYPLFLATVFYLAPIADFTFARVLGVLLDLFSNLLIVLIAFRLVGRVASIICGIVYAVYFPFILASTTLLLESSTSFLILLTLYLMIRGAEANRCRLLIMAGIAAGLLVLNKPTASLMAIPLAAGFCFYARRGRQRSILIRQLVQFMTPVLIVLAGWLTVTSARYGQLAVRDPVYVDGVLRQSSSITYEGYDLDKVGPDFWTHSVWDNIISDVPGYVGLIAKKLDRLWSSPFNDNRKQFVLPHEFQGLVHLVVVSLGLIGLLAIALRRFDLGAWPFLIVGYYTAIHLVFHALARYNFNAMPMMIICAAWLVASMAKMFEASAGRQKRLAVLFLSMTLLLFGWLVEPDWFNAVLGTGLSLSLVVTALFLKTGCWIAALALLSWLFLGADSRWKRVLFVVSITTVFITTSWTSTLARDAWAEFSCRLDNPAVKAGTRIYLPRIQEFGDKDLLALLIDVNSPSGRQNSFTVTIGDVEREFVGGKKPLADLFYPKPAYKETAKLESIGIEQFRQYAIIPVDPVNVQHLSGRYGYLDVAVAINDRFDEPDNYVTLYGSYPVGRERVFIPSLRHTSIERYVQRRDPRIRLPVNFVSDSSVSYYIGRNETDISACHDLSPSPGMQCGRYNVFLMHFKGDGGVVVY